MKKTLIGFENQETNIIIGRDFNVRIEEEGATISHTNGKQMQRKSRDKISYKEGEKFIELVEENG